MAVRSPFDQLRGGPPQITRQPQVGRIVRVDGGVFAVPLESTDQRVPVGPCRGVGDLDPTQIGRICLIVWTQERPWIFLDVVTETPGGP